MPVLDTISQVAEMACSLVKGYHFISLLSFPWRPAFEDQQLTQLEMAKCYQSGIACLCMCARWRSNIKYAKYASQRHQVASTLISAVPCYGASLLQVSRFCQEILGLRILPVGER